MEATGTVDVSYRGEKILFLESLTVLQESIPISHITHRNKAMATAQRFISGIDVDFLSIPYDNERNINFINKQ